MRITVIGQKGNGPVLRRTVSIEGFVRGWGPYAPILWNKARTSTLEIEGHRVRVVIAS